tara:strand:+ start:130 stop:357 length:228 start_codon:yes stop_codon:yes gene_type:complete
LDEFKKVARFIVQTNISISCKKFEKSTLEVTQAENWLFLTGFPFLDFFNFFAISGIQEKIEFKLIFIHQSTYLEV